MRCFSVQQLLLDNAFEFCNKGVVSDEWKRLVYEEFYVDWMLDELNTTDLAQYMDEHYALFQRHLETRVVEQTPVFQSDNIELHRNQYRVTLQINDERVRQYFNTLDEARRFRDEALDHPKVSGAMAKAFSASLKDQRSMLTAA